MRHRMLSFTDLLLALGLPSLAVVLVWVWWRYFGPDDV